MIRLAKVETKVWAGVVGASGGSVLAAAVDWGLGVGVWHASSAAVNAKAAIDAVPGPIAGLVTLGITALGALVGGYAAPRSNHADRHLARGGFVSPPAPIRVNEGEEFVRPT